MPGEIYRDGDIHLTKSFQDLFSQIANLVGTPNVPLIIQRGNIHGAATDSRKVFMGTNYVAMCIPENYHGFQSDMVAAGTAFVIGHELGHITVHPGRGDSWMNSITTLPIDAYEQREMANIISDIMVNYMVGKGTNFIEQGTEFGNQLKDKLQIGFESRGFFRIGSDTQEKQQCAVLLSRGTNNFGQPMIDNRYTPPESTGLAQGDYYPNAGPDQTQVPSRDAANPTPFWQEQMGYGRGSQTYPPLQLCVHQDNPDTGMPFEDNWKSVMVAETLTIHYCSPCRSYQVYQDIAGQCPICKNGTSVSGRVNAGTYPVTRVMTYDGRMNPLTCEPIANYEINGTWVPARYTMPTSPDTGLPLQPNWLVHFGYRGEQSEGVFGEARYTFGTRFLILMEWAGIYATRPEGYDGKKGRLAAEKFIKDMGYTLHAATMEAGGVGV